MNINEAIKKRKSIRGYKPDTVSKKTLQNIIEVAIRAPSAMNTQPWELHIVTGEILDKIKKGNIDAFTAGNLPIPDIALKKNYQDIFKMRQVEIGIQLFKLMGIERDDHAKKNKWMQRGFRFFDAPAAIILTYDKILDPAFLSFFDMGGLTHAICLCALEHNLGTCIHGQGIMYPNIIREHVGIPDSKKIFISISIGYPDWEFSANKVESKRESLENIVSWYGFK